MAEEDNIIRKVIDGEVESFGILERRYQKPIVSMINHIINNSHTSEDIAQEVFLTAYKKLASFDPARSKFSTWLFTIARNKALNVYKKKKPWLQGEMEEKIDPQTTGAEAGQQEYFDRLDRALEKLPRGQKMALVMAELEQLSYEDIAQIEGIRIGTVKSRINRAKKKLRATLSEQKGKV